MAKNIKKILSMVVALCLCVSVLPLQALATEVTENSTELSPEGLTTNVTTTTTTTTDANGNKNVTVTIEKETSGTTDSGVTVERTEKEVDKYVSNENNQPLSYSWSDEGYEKKEQAGAELENVEVEVPLQEGESNTATEPVSAPVVSGDEKNGANDPVYNQTTTTVKPGSVTVTNKDVEYKEVYVEKVVDEKGNVISGTDLDYVASQAKPEKGNELVIWVFRGNRTELPKEGETIEVKEGYEYKYLGAGNTSQFLPVYLYGEPASDDEEPVFEDAEGNKYYAHGQGIAEYNKAYIDGEFVELEDAVIGTFGVAQQFVLVDAATGELITTYCADAETPTQKGYNYNIENLEDATYYSDEQAAMIRSITKNGYWGTASGEDGSLDSMKALLRAAKDENGNPVFTEEELALVTDGLALSATQMAIWTFSNKAADMNFYNCLYTNNGNAAGELKTSWASQLVNKKADKEDSYEVLFKLYNHLITLAPTPIVEKTTANTVVNADNFLSDLSVKVIGKDKTHDNNKDNNKDNDAYETDISFALVVAPSTENGDDMIVKLVDTNGAVIAEARIAGEAKEGEQVLTPDANGNYTFSGITLIEGNQTINISLEGIQNLEKGVYLYTSEAIEDVTSQTLVGLAGGKRAVSVNMSLTFDLDVKDEVIVTERVWRNAGDPSRSYGRNTPPERQRYTPEPTVYRLVNDDTVTIEDEEVPLAATPETGDASGLWVSMIIAAVIGLCVVNVFTKKRQNEAF